MSCQKVAPISPTKNATSKLTPTAILDTILLFKLIGWPTKLSGSAIIQGIFEAVEIRKFIKRKRRENIKTARKISILLPNDLINTWVKPISPNHHQSTTKATSFEKKIKMTKSIPNNIQVNIFVAFILNKKPDPLSWPVIISDGSPLQDAYLDHSSCRFPSLKAILDNNNCTKSQIFCK